MTIPVITPKKILTDLIPFLVEIINSGTMLKTVYSFSVSLKRKFENPNDIQYFKKEIEVEILSVEDINNIENILTTSINNIRGPREYYRSVFLNSEHGLESVPEDDKEIVLTVTRIELI